MKIKTILFIPWRSSLKQTLLLMTMFVGVAFVWQAQAQDYCTPSTVTTDNFTYIDGFSASGDTDQNIENTDTGASLDGNGYSDYTNLPALKVNVSAEVDFTVDIYGEPYGDAGVRIWVDWDKDGQFDTSEEVVYSSDGYSVTHNGSFAIPDGTSGIYRLRVGASGNTGDGPSDPCEYENTGEYEDYVFQVLALEDCEGMPSAGTPDKDSMEVCAAMAFELSVSGATEAANNLNRTWQSSPAGEEDWSDINGANPPSYTVQEGVYAPTDFRYVVTCNEDNTDISSTISVTLKSANDCYCTPENNMNSNYYISNVSTTGALQNIDNDTEFSDNGYGDYSGSQKIKVYPGQEFDYSVSGSKPGMYYIMWLDMDQNGDFDDLEERIGDSESFINSPFTGSFEVPSGLEEGSYNLRVRTNWISEAVGPCEDDSYGETEDYTLQVLIPDCYPPANIDVNYITVNSAGVSWDTNDESQWIVYYSETGFDPEIQGQSIDVFDTPTVNLTDLDEDTTYDVYVKTICGEGENEESILAGPVNFTTSINPPENVYLCDAIALNPNNGCMDGPYTNVAAFEEYLEPTGSCLNQYHGNNSVWFTFTGPADGLATITTDFSSTDFSTEIAVFQAPEDCADMTTLGTEVGCANTTNDGILEVEGLNPGEIYYVKVAGFNNAEGEFCIEVQMDETPVCMAPSEINIGEITEDSVEVSWTAGEDETQWEVIYGEAGFNPETTGQSEIVNTTQVTLTDLTPETDYEVYVRAICTQLNSDLAGPELFTTEPMSVDSQVFANFNFYPNPVKDQLTLKAGSPIEKVEVYNLLGQRMMELEPNTLETNVNTEKLQSGIYLMNVTLNGSQKTFRVVKK